jgi:long-chain acyl-CoA synthetase
MSIGLHARTAPERPAMINSLTGEVLTYRELDERSARFAHYLTATGVKRGDAVALFMENNARFMEIVWATRRLGLYIVAINRYLNADEARYIVNDCDAVVLVTSAALAEVAAGLTDRVPLCRARLMVDGVIDGWDSYEAAVATCPAEPPEVEWLGDLMLYSSGTTGRPKGAPGVARCNGRWGRPDQGVHRWVWVWPGYGVSVAGTDVSRRAAGVLPGGASRGRDRGDDAAVRCRSGAGSD